MAKAKSRLARARWGEENASATGSLSNLLTGESSFSYASRIAKFWRYCRARLRVGAAAAAQKLLGVGVVLPGFHYVRLYLRKMDHHVCFVIHHQNVTVTVLEQV
jgi:hypothetical protein